MRTAREIREEIEARFGFFPPFFTPAEDDPRVLENLWQQTLLAYVENPIPALFREKLFAWLSRYCVVPYCIVCHSCALRPLGMRASEVLELLESLPPAHGAIDETLARLDASRDVSEDWPAPGSALEEDVFRCSVFLFVHQARAERCRERVRRLLGPGLFNHLLVFLAYVKACHLWVEAHPELSYEADARAREHLGPLLQEEPRLGDFFAGYAERVRQEREAREREEGEAARAGERAEALSQTVSRQTEALRENEAHLRLALESAALGTWDLNPLTGELRWDARCKALFGLPVAAEVDFSTFQASIVPEERERVEASVARALIPGGGGEYREEFHIRRFQDGMERWISSRGQCFFDERGRAVRFIGTVMDVTERRRAEDNLRFLAEASALLATSLDYEDTLRRVASLTVPVLADWCGVDVVDERGRMRRLINVHRDPEKVRLSEEIHRRYPIDPNATSGAPRVLRTGEPELIPEISDEALAHYARDAEHLRLMRELGLRSYLTVALRSRERVLGTLTLVRAETARRYGQEELRLAEELARRAAVAVDNALLYREAQKAIGLRDGFLQVAAHELRTPVTALKLNVQALVASTRKEEAWSERTVSRLTGLERGVGRLGVLVDELLDVSRITSGRMVLRPEELDLAELVREVAGRFRSEAERGDCVLRVRVPGPVAGRWDRLRLEQVLSNLLSNALKYGAGQPVEVTLSTVPSTSGERVLLRVRDEGIGMESAVQARIFERFERAVSDRHYGGLGMGLWITREIVTAMGGTIQVESAPGQGATFTVELPRG
ncbi:PAS domain S-box-containing protein [Archangium gephyra]|uniref:histidine kinase n=1 Tax=Archangium gephyra TaxID=48 RepID=A0AAC8Q1C8_9BACT|nr:GAF domain-containing sensor histidine kinase [Archangium gephyra]AKI99199.1 Sensory box histidine kinase [Archangium gephyra]REG31103.1 PAS domain S-box-containing protein [Archangium gephyra]